MLFSVESNPFNDDSWGVTIEYEQDGYVEDRDAANIDYSDMLIDMKESTRESSKQRVEMGYEPIELVGWAAPPYYDAQTKKLYWAKEIRFCDADFDPDMDEVAAYGLGALVAGKVIAKTGFLAAAFIFLKKFGVIILIAVGALIKKVFFGKKDKSEDKP